MSESKKAKPVANATPEFFSRQVSEARRFYLNLKPAKTTPLSVVSGGFEHCLPDYRIQRPSFPFFSIEYVVRGAGSLRLNHRHYRMQPGLVYSYGPGVRHTMSADPEAAPSKYFLNFAGPQSKAILRACRLPLGSVSQLALPHELQNLFDELIHCAQRGRPGAHELCAKLLECVAMRIAESQIPHESVETLSLLSYQNCRKHIEENFQRLKTLEQIAAECHLDAAYLCRLFQRYDHQSPYKFLMRLKMNLAAEWLEKPGALVKQVAERAGFRDQFHFSRAFKNVLGVPPNTFRRLR
ncbi:MAG TPA: AraC family transcriptional regulator [Candidatus Baltobacteraceae bacterium]|nr:AraC family transcriptional regulator [Candidatus Baltobacteraceae bacterium]